MTKILTWFLTTVLLCLGLPAVADGPLFLGDVYGLTNSDINCMVIADLDNDGDDDIVAGLDSYRMAVVLTHANGTLARAMVYDIGEDNPIVETSDINSDGYLDIVLVTEYDYDNILRVYLNNGWAEFNLAGDYATYNNGGGLATFDVDGDGDEDIVHASTTYLGVFINNGDGTLQDRVDYTCGPNWSYIPGVADFNGDGDLDVAVPNYGYDTLRVMFNDGDGAFDSLVSYATCTHPQHAIAAKINDDEYYDVVVCSWGDVASALTFHFNNGDGTFADTVTIDLPTRCMYAEAADIDGDGDNDLIAAQWLENDHALLVLRNNGDGTFASPENYPSEYPHSIKCSDFDKDGDLDIAVGGWAYGVEIKYNDGAGNFTGAPSYGIGNRSYAVSTGDIDGDMDIDFITANYITGVALKHINNGDSTFTVSTDTLDVGSSPKGIVLADLDGVNGPDLVATNESADSITVLLNNGNGTFAAGVSYLTDYEPSRLIAGHLNADSYDDLAVVNYYSDDVAIFLSNGDGTLADPVMYTVSDEPHDITFGDIDGDGDIDLMTSSYFGYPYAITPLTNDGNGVFTVEPIIDALRYSYGILLFDYTGDGKEDIFLGDDSGLRFYVGNGDGTFNEPDSNMAVAYAVSPVAGDFDKDGDLDLAFGFDGWRFIAVMINNDGNFIDPVYYITPYYCRGLAAADLDGDNDLELIGVTSDWTYPNSAIVLWNRTEQLPTDIDDNTGSTPNLFTLKQNYPNPFNPVTRIDYTVPANAHVTITVYNVLGQEIRTLVDETKAAGSHTVVWDGRNDNRETVASGIYFYQITADNYVAAKKMVLLK